MIRMSRGQASFLIVALCLAGLAGCCGGSGTSHKCDFTPPGGGMDAGASDAALPCGTAVCDQTQVCCVKKAPAVALCIQPADFLADGCEKLELPCIAPADCPGGLGLVCCEVRSPPLLSCLPAQICPGDGVNTFRTCSVDADCPSHRIGSCYPLSTIDDDGGTLNVCSP